MGKQNIYPKVSLDLYWVQLSWTFWFLGIYLLVNIVRHIFGMTADSFFAGVYIAGNIYMFVVGIITINFLSYYVENGVTRKDYFIGNLIASFGLSVTLPILANLISWVEKLLFNNIRDAGILETVMAEVVGDLDGNILAEVIVSFILTPFVSPENNLLLSLVIFSLNLFVFYLAGWLISAAFNRLGVIVGILFIIVALVLVGIKDSMMRLALDLPLFETFAFFDAIPSALAWPALVITLLLMIILIRLITKRTPIKI